MGVYDRDYFRSKNRTNPFSTLTQSAVGTLIAINVAVWIIEMFVAPAESFLSASPRGLAHLQVYELLTAPFTHSTSTVYHIGWNMLFLYFFGRELEQIYGRLQFAVFYVAAGSISVLVEVIGLWVAGANDVYVLGASGAVMGVVVLFTLFYPQRRILFMFFLPLPVWVLCALFVVQDLVASVSGVNNGVANLAHLAGAGLGFLYWYLDFRPRRVQGVLRRWRQRRAAHRAQARILQMPRQPDPRTRDISRRIDELLEKISLQGKESLSEEEWTFLKENSGRYRS